MKLSLKIDPTGKISKPSSMNDYNERTAAHYAIYRPSLHAPILNDALGGTKYSWGLDIGCGTGHSTIALTSFCRRVVGIDTSAAMLNKAIPHQQIAYQLFDGKKLNFAEQTFDLITFAGSFYYAKSQQVLDEVKRVARARARLIIYDFDVRLEPIWSGLKLPEADRQKSAYLHDENLIGLECKGMEKLIHQQKIRRFFIRHHELAHLILSVPSNYELVRTKFGATNILEALVVELELLKQKESFELLAHTYTQVYRINITK